MGVPVVWIYVVVGMGMARAIRMGVFVFVKDNLKMASEYVGHAAQGPQTWNVRATFKAGHHRLRHAQTFRELHLCFAGIGAKL